MLCLCLKPLKGFLLLSEQNHLPDLPRQSFQSLLYSFLPLFLTLRLQNLFLFLSEANLQIICIFFSFLVGYSLSTSFYISLFLFHMSIQMSLPQKYFLMTRSNIAPAPSSIQLISFRPFIRVCNYFNQLSLCLFIDYTSRLLQVNVNLRLPVHPEHDRH